MEWYFGSNMDELMVPKDQEVSDMFSPPESWLKWEISEPESFAFPNKGMQKLNFNGGILFNEVEVESSSYDKDRCSSSIGGGSSESSLHQTAPSCHQPELQLYSPAGFEQMDDLFLSSFIEDPPETENLHNSFCFEPELQNGMLHGDSILTDMNFNTESISVNAHGMGCSKYLKSHAYSPSLDQEKGRVSVPQFISRNFEQKHCPSVKARPVKVLVPSEHNSMNQQVDEETSLEESVLQELEMVMAQMTDKARLCFRDALYRLAKSSRQHGVAQNQNGNLSMETSTWTGQEENIRLEGKKTTELETNTIDRAIANLMFNKIDINVNGFPVAAASISSKNDESLKATRLPTYSCNQPQVCSLPQYPIFSSDNEVPNLCQAYSQTQVVPRHT